jgi:transcriptional regulator with XRE-family HTH domain
VVVYTTRRSMMSWGKDIQALRNGLGITQRQLAIDLGVSLHTVTGWEGSGTRPKSFEVAKLELYLKKKLPDGGRDEYVRRYGLVTRGFMEDLDKFLGDDQNPKGNPTAGGGQ